MIVYLGNSGALDNGKPLEGKLITTVNIPDVWTRSQALAAIKDRTNGLWVRHSSNATPDWVECDNDGLALDIAEYYGDIPIGRTEGEWK